MIPIDYLRASRKGREVRPRYLNDDKIASEVINMAKSAKTLGEFRNAVELISSDKKLVRGLAHDSLLHIPQF